jgi:hypothetical protein
MAPLQGIGLVPRRLGNAGTTTDSRPLQPLKGAVQPRQCDLCGIIIFNIFQ